MRETVAIVVAIAVAIGIATLFAAGLDHVPHIGFIQFVYLVVAIIVAVGAWFFTAKAIGFKK